MPNIKKVICKYKHRLKKKKKTCLRLVETNNNQQISSD